MSVITWGKPKIEIAKYEDGALPQSPVWKEIPTPKENTTTLTSEKGDKKEAKVEGGELVDVKVGKNKYTFEFELYKTRGMVLPIEDEDGVVVDNYAVRLTPEDETLEGFIIEKSSVSVEKNWSSEDGETLKYTFEALKPATGKMCKTYKKV